MARTASTSNGAPTRAPDLVTSPIAAEQLVAELHEHADTIEREAAEHGTSRITAARVKVIRRHAVQIERLHAHRDDDQGDEA